MQTVNFILIKNLCIVDLIGALVILPVPLVATARGRFDFGDAWCTANSIINVALWFQHIVMFAMLKVLCSKIKMFEHFILFHGIENEEIFKVFPILWILLGGISISNFAKASIVKSKNLSFDTTTVLQ